jgi:hypothetical protein
MNITGFEEHTLSPSDEHCRWLSYSECLSAAVSGRQSPRYEAEVLPMSHMTAGGSRSVVLALETNAGLRCLNWLNLLRLHVKYRQLMSTSLVSVVNVGGCV